MSKGSAVVELQVGVDPREALAQIHMLAPFARCVWYNQRNWVVCGAVVPRPLLEQVPGVARILYVEVPYPLASRAFISEPTVVRVGSVEIGGAEQVVIGGPCSVESREQLLNTATFLAARGCHILRGGAFKPRTSPYTFQGLGREGLQLLAEARETTGMPFVTEVLTPEDVDLVAEYADMVQIGARNMQNFQLLRAVGRAGKPVLLKRSPWVNLATWLHAAEYVLAEGNFQVVLCERGICGSEASSTGRFLDLAAVPKLRQETHLPVVVDPSHGTGQRSLVTPMSLGALAAGADGIMVEVHINPDQALSDGFQSLDLPQFDLLMEKVRRLQHVNLYRPSTVPV